MKLALIISSIYCNSFQIHYLRHAFYDHVTKHNGKITLNTVHFHSFPDRCWKLLEDTLKITLASK